jgi:opacity protein-like surface antigen
MLEAYGTNLTLSPAKDYVLINGKRWLISDNLAAEVGYSIQTYLKYSVLKQGYINGIFNAGYNRLYSHHDGPDNTTYGVKVQSFSLGLGAEAVPLAKYRFSPSVFGILRLNFMGGETFHLSGLDFFKVTPRFGYTAGINLIYRLKTNISILLGYSYSYDNLWNKQTDETTTNDAHVIVFRDKASTTNGLTHDRRVAYWSLYTGISFNL